MKALAEADGDVFLPNPAPVAPAGYVFVCTEPYLGRWARSADEARSKVEEKRNGSLSSKFNVNLTENAKPKGVQSRRLGATQLKCVLGSYFTHQDKALHVMRNFRAVVL